MYTSSPSNQALLSHLLIVRLLSSLEPVGPSPCSNEGNGHQSSTRLCAYVERAMRAVLASLSVVPLSGRGRQLGASDWDKSHASLKFSRRWVTVSSTESCPLCIECTSAFVESAALNIRVHMRHASPLVATRRHRPPGLPSDRPVNDHVISQNDHC